MAVNPVQSIGAMLPIRPITFADAPRPGATPVGGDFLSTFARALGELDAAQGAADALSLQAATGDLESLSAYMVAANQAQLLTELTVAVRDRAVEAFNDVMRIQL
jgi:flagellar hook-basal body complex protein FliE